MGQAAVRFSNGICRALHGFSQLAGGVIPAGGMDPAQIIPDIDPLADDVRKIPLLNAPAQILIKDDGAEDIVQAGTIRPVGGGGKAQQQPGGKVIQQFAVAFGRGMVGFIHHNGVKSIRGVTVQPVAQALHRCADHLGIRRGVLGTLFHAGFAGEVFQRLVDKFFPVG